MGDFYDLDGVKIILNSVKGATLENHLENTRGEMMHYIGL
jgi:hypothetical protein